MKQGATTNDLHVGTRVRLRRMLLSMSQEKLGELLGLTFQQVQKYEKGVNRIGAGRLFEIANILGVPVEYFFVGLAPKILGMAGPGAGIDLAPDVLEFMGSGEGLQLSLNYMKIKEPKLRRRVLDLVKEMAEPVAVAA